MFNTSFAEPADPAARLQYRRDRLGTQRRVAQHLSTLFAIPPAAPILDTETFCPLDLSKCGVDRYAEQAGVSCMSYKMPGWVVPAAWWEGQPIDALDPLLTHMAKGGTIRAWNAPFDGVIWNRVIVPMFARLGYTVPALAAQQLECIMVRSLFWGLPGKLEQAGAALALPIQKDMEGSALTKRMSRPRGVNPDGSLRWWHREEPDRLHRQVAYCNNDVETEYLADRAIPDITPAERLNWLVDFDINRRGVGVDVPLVRELQRITLQSGSDLHRAMALATDGRVDSTNKVAALLKEARNLGYTEDNLAKATLAEVLANPNLPTRLRQILMIRREAAKTSTAKLNAMENARNSRGVVSGMLQFYGAGRTGREAGRLVQPQNMVRPTVKDITAKIQQLLAYAAFGQPMVLEAIENWGSPLDVVASALRGCFIPDDPDDVFVAGDLKQIEARTLPWLSQQDDLVQVFASGEDVYVHEAAKQGSADRQFGKVLVLSCGYGVGAKTFIEMALGYGLRFTLDEAELAVQGWRNGNPQTVQFWWATEDAARQAIMNPGTFVIPLRKDMSRHEGELIFYRSRVDTGEPDVLLMILPSGRPLVYRNPELRDMGGYKPTVTYMGVDQYTKKWTRIKTYGGMLVENATQATSRDVFFEAILNGWISAKTQGLPYTFRLHVHDELICQAPRRLADEARSFVVDIMRQRPAWCPSLPVDVDAQIMERYGK